MKQQKKINDYKRQRLAAKELWTKIFRTVDKKDLKRAAKMLDIWEEPNRLVLGDEYDFDIFTEFCLFNYKIEGKSMVEIYASQHTPEDEMERVALESGVHSKSSLFLV